MSWLKTLLGVGNVAENVLDKDKGLLAQVGGWIGSYQFTDQERNEANAKLTAVVVDYAKSTLSESTGRSKARRYLAIQIMRVELVLVLAAVIIWPFDENYAQFVWTVASSTLMAGAFWAVVVFFFGAYGYGAHVKK